MKKYQSLIIVLVFCVLTASKCKKDPVSSNGLPAATQTGANTLGFMLNGQVWTPQGYNGTANLSTDVDFGYSKGIFNISAYRIITTGNREYFSIYADSLNFISIPKTISLGKNSSAGIYFSNNDCAYNNSDSTVNQTGIISILKLDKINRIITGTFYATLTKSGCTTIIITDGRFDLSF